MHDGHACGEPGGASFQFCPVARAGERVFCIGLGLEQHVRKRVRTRKRRVRPE